MNNLLQCEVAHRVTVLKVAIQHLEDGAQRGDMARIISSRVACASVDVWVQEATTGMS